MLDWLTNGLAGPLTALLAFCAAAGLVVLLRRWQYRVGEGRRATVESRAERREAESVRRTLEELLAEVERAAARLDERINAQLRLLESAEARIASRISALSDLEARHECDELHVVQKTPPKPAESTRSPARSRSPIVSQTRDALGADERHQAIYALADSGASPAAIAEARRSPIGEIELILNLRRLATSRE